MKSTYLFILILILTFVNLITISFVNAVGSYPSCTVDNGCILYYHFNNQSAYGENDTNVYDFSGNGNNGTANNTLFQPNTGILNDGSMYFNGVNSSIITKDNISLRLNTSFTINLWIYINNQSNPFPNILRKGASNYQIYYFNSSNTLNWKITNSTGTYDNQGISPYIGEWNMYTVSYNSSSNSSIYLDGVLMSTVSSSGVLSSSVSRYRYLQKVHN